MVTEKIKLNQYDRTEFDRLIQEYGFEILLDYLAYRCEREADKIWGQPSLIRECHEWCRAAKIIGDCAEKFSEQNPSNPTTKELKFWRGRTEYMDVFHRARAKGLAS